MAEVIKPSKEPVKIYWMSRHAPLQSQVTELKRLFGDDVVIMQDPQPFSYADDIISRFRLSGADELVIVAPLSVIAQIVQRGIKPLWAEMEQVTNPEEAETEAAGRLYRFVRFRRIVGIQLQFEEVEPVRKLDMAKVVRSSKEIAGIEMKVGDEWDAGYIPAGAAHRRCRVTVRKDAPYRWSVYAISFLGNKKLASWDILTFQCETCAKAFASCVVSKDKNAECPIHKQDGFSDSDTYTARVAVLCCLFGLSQADFVSLPPDAIWMLLSAAHRISDSRLTWQHVMKAIKVAEQLRSKYSLSWEVTMIKFYYKVEQVLLQSQINRRLPVT